MGKAAMGDPGPNPTPESSSALLTLWKEDLGLGRAGAVLVPITLPSLYTPRHTNRTTNHHRPEGSLD